MIGEGSAAPQLEGQRVLIVEDDVFIAMDMADLLQALAG